MEKSVNIEKNKIFNKCNSYIRHKLNKLYNKKIVDKIIIEDFNKCLINKIIDDFSKEIYESEISGYLSLKIIFKSGYIISNKSLEKLFNDFENKIYKKYNIIIKIY